jgi:hypothetical protein
VAWFAVYRQADNALVSTGTVIPSDAELGARGLVKAPLDGPPAGGAVWNPVTHSFDGPPAVEVLAEAEAIIAAFQPQEWAAARAMVAMDPAIAWWFDRLMTRREPVNVAGDTFGLGLAYLVQVDVLTQERADAIGSALGL